MSREDFPPVVAVPSSVGDLASWLADAGLTERLSEHGAVLLRGTSVRTPASLAVLRDALIAVPSLPGESFGSRELLADGVFSTTRWPAERVMCPQHEESYSLTVPRVVLIGCLQPAATGGETLLSDSRRLLSVLPSALVARLREHGWRMTRTFRDRMGVSWREAFGVADESALEELCARDGIEVSWEAGGVLRTSRTRAAVVRHPLTGEDCWFNHAGFFNVWALVPEDREVLLAAFGEDGLPLNTFAGDGSPFSSAEVHSIEEAYETVSRPVRWEAGDVLLLDNILMAHGRRAFTGDRLMAKAMGEPVALGAFQRS